MGFIKVRLEGHKKNGGYLTIMRDMSYEALKASEMRLYDGNIIDLSNGPQTVRFDPVGLYKREKVKMELISAKNSYRYSNEIAGSKFDRYSDAISADSSLPSMIDYTLTVENNTLLTIVVSSDYKGDIIGQPDFIVSYLTDDEFTEIEKKQEEKRIAAEKTRLENQRRREEEDEKIRQNLKKRARTSVIKSLILLIVSIVFIIIAFSSEGLITLIGFVGLAGGIWAIKMFLSNIFKI